ncbi:hypothetical protein BV25DRAFT_1824656 [Artomyces pyxidatus]|uniref:Uncharacterized protein n=1 Tax=Artomyces pyxidatus TaxID=48021 RepID=A0ACB8T4R2_9AGAM|nr:hypothetical protein BV25DRAFT_1824656 [Artomyces pyxidatus]
MPPKARIVRKTSTTGSGPGPSPTSGAPPAGRITPTQTQPPKPVGIPPQKLPTQKAVPVSGPPSKTASNAGSSSAPKEGSMLPPPDPQPPKAILESEMDALANCLRAAAVKTGQIYGFYADARRLGIHNYAPHPPQSLTAALGREVERYDQLCDTMESQLLRAIAVLQRDLDRAQAQAQAEAEAEALRKQPKPEPPSPKAAEALLAGTGLQEQPTPSTPPPTVPAASTSAEEMAGPHAIPPSTPQASPPIPGTTTHSARRYSTVALSTLNRPQFPHKLDLSAAALRINPEEITQGLGLASPVTLAPKSGRLTATNEFPPDFIAALASSDPANRPVDIDLTLPDTDPSVSAHLPGDSALGSSADRPIELDLDSMDIDMQDLFGDDAPPAEAADPVAFLASAAPSEVAQGKKKDEGELDIEMFSALSGNAETHNNADLFSALSNASLGSTSQPPAGGNSSTQGSSRTAPSPGAILAFAAGADASAPSNSTDQALDGGDASFDMSALDFSSFPSSDMTLLDMEALLGMGGVDGGNSQSAGS